MLVVILIELGPTLPTIASKPLLMVVLARVRQDALLVGDFHLWKQPLNIYNTLLTSYW